MLRKYRFIFKITFENKFSQPYVLEFIPGYTHLPYIDITRINMYAPNINIVLRPLYIFSQITFSNANSPNRISTRVVSGLCSFYLIWTLHK